MSCWTTLRKRNEEPGRTLFHALRFPEPAEGEHHWFNLLDGLHRQRWQYAWPEESPEGHAVSMMLRDRAYWLRN
jgi:hypothetical protein